MREPNRLTSQEWHARLAGENAERATSEQAKLLDEVIGVLERGEVARTDSRLKRLRNLLDELERSD